MGSLTSRPKVPVSTAQPQIVYVPQPAPTSTTTTATVSTGSTGTPLPSEQSTSPNTPEDAASTARVENLLRRNRGITGTIQTGFRGLLSQTKLIPQRKTLLGE